MPTSLIVAPPHSAAPTASPVRATVASTGAGSDASRPMWGLRIDDNRVALVLQGAPLPLGGRLGELTVALPHVRLPFDFADGLVRFQHHRGRALSVSLSLDLEALFSKLRDISDGMISGRAVNGALIFSGHTEQGARFTVRARVVPDLADSQLVDEPTLMLSLYDLRVYGRTDEPWALLATRVLDALPTRWVVERTLSTARLAVLRETLCWALSELAWKLPALSELRLNSARILDGRLDLDFRADTVDEWVTLDASANERGHESLGLFLEDLELKQHHGTIDRALQAGQRREAMAEIYRAMAGPLRPGFLAERLIGICAATPVLFDEGEKVCREVLAQAAGYPTALCGLASIAMGRGLMEEAAVHFERLSTALSGSTERQDAIAADMTLAESLRAIDREEARAALERILKRAPNHEEALDTLVRMAIEVGDQSTALKLSKRLLFAAQTPERTREAGLALARNALEHGEREEAQVYLEVVLEAVPSNMEARLALSEVASDDEAAMQVLEEALRRARPGDSEGILTVATSLVDRALSVNPPQRARARRVLWRTVDNTAASDGHLVALGTMALEADAPDLTERYAGRVPEHSSSWADARCLMARSRRFRGMREDALDIALQILTSHPGHAEALDVVDASIETVTEREHVLRTLERVQQNANGPARGRLQAARGALFEALGLEWDAIGPYETAITNLRPSESGWGRAATRLLELYPRYGLWTQHQRLCDTWLNHHEDPDARVPFLVARGRVALDDQDDPTFALPSLREAIAIAPRQLDALELLARALERVDEIQELVGVLRRLESIHPDEQARIDARIRLAELFLTRLEAPAQAQAAVAKLPGRVQNSARVLALRQSLDGARRGSTPAQMEVSTAPADASASPHATLYARAVAASDEGDLPAAQRFLDAWLLKHPLDTAGLELARLFAVERGDVEKVTETTDALLALVVARPARIALVRETMALVPATRERYADILERLVSQNAAKHAPSASAVPPAPPATIPEPQPDASDPLPEPARRRLAENDVLDKAVAKADTELEKLDYAAAAATLHGVLDADPDHVVALELQARLQEATEQWRALADTLTRLADLSFDAEQTLAYTLQRADLLADVLDDEDEAAKAWSQYVEWQPLDDPVFDRLRRYLERSGRHAQLLDILQTRVDAISEELPAAPGHAQAALTHRWVDAQRAQAQIRLHALDDGEGALLAIDEALRLRSEDPELLVVKVRILAHLGERKACRALLDEVLPLLLPGPLKDELQLLRGNP